MIAMHACSILSVLSLLVFSVPAWADVIRCTDAAGRVTYSDQESCPPGAKRTGNVAVPEAAGPYDPESARPAQDQLESVERARQAQREAVASATRSSPGGGVTVIDSRGSTPPGSGSSAPASDPRMSDRDAGIVAETQYPDGAYGGYPGGVALPPRDMRPRLRQCNGNGCNDTQGNHYNRQGRIDRYQNGDGRTCRQVNSTQICR